MSYECEICEKSFTRQYNLKKHQISRKLKCEKPKYKREKINGKIRHLCNYCDKNYSKISYLYFHMNKEHEMEILKTKLAIYEKKTVETTGVMNKNINIENASNINIDNSTNNTNNTNNSINIVLPVNAYSNPSMEHLDEKLVNKVFTNLFQYLPQILAETNFNKNHPENHNMYLKNVKNKIYKIFDGLGYQEVTENIFFRNFINNYICALDSYVQKLIDEDRIDSNDSKIEKFDQDCTELEQYAFKHKNNLKVNKYRTLYDGLWGVFMSSKDLVKTSMDNGEYHYPDGEVAQLEYKDDKIYKQIVLT